MDDRVPCYCFEFLIDPKTAKYVKDGRPMCEGFTCSQVNVHNKQGYGTRIPLASLDENDRAAG